VRSITTGVEYANPGLLKKKGHQITKKGEKRTQLKGRQINQLTLESIKELKESEETAAVISSLANEMISKAYLAEVFDITATAYIKGLETKFKGTPEVIMPQPLGFFEKIFGARKPAASGAEVILTERETPDRMIVRPTLS
jgi:hypothetical protein